MGVHSRMLSLLANTNDNRNIEDIISGYRRLVESDQMGSVYKVMAFSTLKYLTGFT